MNSPQKETIKAGGIKTITSIPHIYAIILMGLFTFVFLSVEYMFVSRISLLVSQQKATLSQNYVLGVSTAGFLLYPLFKHFLNNRLYKLLMIITGLLSVSNHTRRYIIYITPNKSKKYKKNNSPAKYIFKGLTTASADC